MNLYSHIYSLPSNNGTALMEAIALVGPVSIAVDASTWTSYSSGIYTGCDAAAPQVKLRCDVMASS